jgi:hypothetical protein
MKDKVYRQVIWKVVDQINDQVGGHVWWRVREQIEQDIESQVWDQFLSAVSGKIWDHNRWNIEISFN